MQKKFGFSLADLADPEKTARIHAKYPDTLLFKWNENSMSDMVNAAAVKAGYPNKMFSYHSLRSGISYHHLLLLHSSMTNGKQDFCVLP